MAGIKSLSGLIRQFLNMGVNDVDPSSVVWNGNRFSALNFSGVSCYGMLDISNNLPFRLAISMETNSSPLQFVEYAYPDQSASLGMYPSKIKIIFPHEDEPKIEIHLQSVLLATQQLAEAFFSAAKVVGSNISHTCIFSNESEFISDTNGKMLELPKQLIIGISHPPVGSVSNKRWVILVLFGITTAVPLIIFGSFRKKKKENKKQ